MIPKETAMMKGVMMKGVTDHWLAKLSLGVHKGLFENYFG